MNQKQKNVSLQSFNYQTIIKNVRFSSENWQYLVIDVIDNISIFICR